MALSEEQKVKEALILVALGKAFSEQATFLTGELRHKPKQTFNQAVQSVDLMVKTIEQQLSEADREYLAGITDVYHNINLEIKRSK